VVTTELPTVLPLKCHETAPGHLRAPPITNAHRRTGGLASGMRLSLQIFESELLHGIPSAEGARPGRRWNLHANSSKSHDECLTGGARCSTISSGAQECTSRDARATRPGALPNQFRLTGVFSPTGATRSFVGPSAPLRVQDNCRRSQ
jgi:hypothetical protein